VPNLKPNTSGLRPFKRGERRHGGGGRARIFDKAMRQAMSEEDRIAIVRNIIEIAKGEKGKVGDQVAAARFIIERIDGKTPFEHDHKIVTPGVILNVDVGREVRDLPPLPIGVKEIT
jgi:hypothetical protein